MIATIDNIFQKSDYFIKSRYLIIMLLLFASHVEAMEVVVATGINHDPPYVYGDTTIAAEFPGVTIDILRLIETKSDMKFIIEKRPWKRVVHDVKHNLLDGGFHFSYKEERKSFVAYPIIECDILPDPKFSISNRSYTIYRLKGKSIRWNGSQIVMDSKDNMIIGAIRGGSITGNIIKLGHQLHEVDTDMQLINLLILKRIHGFIGLENMIDPKIKTLAPKKIVLIEKSLPPVVNKPYYIAFSKKFYHENPDKAWKVWKTIELIKTNGELQKIYSKYANRATPPKSN